MLPANNYEAAQEVFRLQREIASTREPSFIHMEEVKDLYNGDTIVPLPELDRFEKPAVANLIMMGVDQHAMRVASRRPRVDYPVLGETDTARNRAADRRRAAYGWWDMNRWELLQRRRSRHLTAYGMTVVSLSPVSADSHDKRHIPFWRVRNPLSTFPAPSANLDSMRPDYCIFRDRRTLSWLERRYPAAVSSLFNADSPLTDMVEVLEYMDDRETVLIAVGPAETSTDHFGREISTGLSRLAPLDRIPNRTGVIPVVIVGRITLDRLAGRYDQALGIYQREAKLDALNTIAIFRNVFADEWAQSPANTTTRPNIIARADGKRGVIGILENGQMTAVRPPMNQEIQMALDRYERGVRMAGSTPASYTGEASSNVRTARQGNDLLSSTVDMALQEDQDLLAAGAELELYVASKMMRAYYGDEPSAFYFGPDGTIPRKDYVANSTFDTDLARVHYPLPGTDLASMTVTFGQMNGMGEISLQTMRELDPRIDDAELEKVRVEVEALEKAYITGLEQRAAQGDMDPATFARILQRCYGGDSLVEAVLAVEDQMKKEQAATANAQATPGTPATPEMQPGVAGSPATQPVAPAPAQSGPPQLSDLLSQLGSAGTSPTYSNQTDMAPAPAPAGV